MSGEPDTVTGLTPSAVDHEPGAVSDAALPYPQQLEALRRIRQADQRVQLGAQLFKAAEAHTTHQHDLLGRIKAQQQRLHEDLARLAGSLSQQDQRADRLERLFGSVMGAMAKRLDEIYARQVEADKRFNQTLARAVDLLEKAEQLMDQTRSASAERSSDPHRAPPIGSPGPRDRVPDDADKPLLVTTTSITPPTAPARNQAQSHPEAIGPSSQSEPADPHPAAAEQQAGLRVFTTILSKLHESRNPTRQQATGSVGEREESTSVFSPSTRSPRAQR